MAKILITLFVGWALIAGGARALEGWELPGSNAAAAHALAANDVGR